MKKYIFIGLVILFLIGSGIAVYEYNKPHRNISKEKTDFSLAAQDLYKDYQQDETGANKKYLNKVIEVKGKITEKFNDSKGNTVLLMKGMNDFFGVSCTFNKEKAAQTANIKTGDTVTVKGICAGGGDMMDAVLVGCERVE